MSLINCSECGNLMVENPSGMCPNCLREEEAAEDKVSDYLRETCKRASLDEISKATGVKTKVIFRMMQRGRLESSNGQITYPCETCGAPITAGRLCEHCSQGILRQIKHEDPPAAPQKPVSGKKEEQMYTRNIFRK